VLPGLIIGCDDFLHGDLPAAALINLMQSLKNLIRNAIDEAIATHVREGQLAKRLSPLHLDCKPPFPMAQSTRRIETSQLVPMVVATRLVAYIALDQFKDAVRF